MKNTKVRASYESWCEQNGYEAKSFAQSLTAHGVNLIIRCPIFWLMRTLCGAVVRQEECYPSGLASSERPLCISF